MMTYVYLIAKLDGNRAVAPVKIGISREPWRRLPTLATSCPFPVVCYQWMGPFSRGDARKHEVGLHDAYRDVRLHGEWFNVDPESVVQLWADYWSDYFGPKFGNLSFQEKLVAMRMFEL